MGPFRAHKHESNTDWLWIGAEMGEKATECSSCCGCCSRVILCRLMALFLLKCNTGNSKLLISCTAQYLYQLPLEAWGCRYGTGQDTRYSMVRTVAIIYHRLHGVYPAPPHFLGAAAGSVKRQQNRWILSKGVVRCTNQDFSDNFRSLSLSQPMIRVHLSFSTEAHVRKEKSQIRSRIYCSSFVIQ